MVSAWIRRKYGTATEAEGAPIDVVALPYLRVSTVKQERGFSPQAQRKEIGEYIRRQGWEPAAEYRDTDRGTKIQRSDYQRLLRDARRLAGEGRRAVVVAVHLDRFGRNLAEQLRARDELIGIGVPLHFTRQGGTLDSDRTVMEGWMAQKETEKLSERVSKSKKIVADMGLPPSSRAGWGYRWRLPLTPEEERLSVGRAIRRILDVHDDEAPYVRELFTRAAKGESRGSLARWVAGLPVLARGGRALGTASVGLVLRQSLYIARYSRDPKDGETARAILALPKGHWPALVSDETWLAVQDQLDAHSRPGRPASGQYLLTRLIFCPRCGNRMNGDKMRVQSRYRCVAHRLGAIGEAARCTYTTSMTSVDALVLDQVGGVLDATAGLIGGDPRILAAARKAWARLQAPQGSQQQKVAELEAMRRKAQNRILLAREALFDGDMPRDEHDALVARNRALIADVNEQLRALGQAEQARETLPDFEEALAAVGGWQQALDAAAVPAQRNVLATLIERVIPRRIGYGKYVTEITWTPLGEALRDLAASLGEAGTV